MEPENNETKTDQQTEQPAQGQEDSQIDVRNHPAFKAITKQINELRAEKEALLAKQKKEAEDAELKKLKDAEDYGALEKRLKNENAQLKESHAAEIRKLTLEAKLAGIHDPLARAGAIAACPPDADIDEYVGTIDKSYFEVPGIKTPNVPAQGAQSGGQTKSLKDRLAAGDQDAMKATFNKILAGETVNLT